MKKLISLLLLLVMGTSFLTATAAKKKTGKDILCGIRGDLLLRNGGLGTFNTAEAYNLTLLQDINHTSDTEYYGVQASAYIKGKYYAYIGLDFTFVTGMKGFGYFDPATYEWHKIADCVPLNEGTDAQGLQVGPYEHVYSMSYNYKTDEAYILCYQVGSAISGTPINCLLCKVNLADGTYKKVAVMPNFYYNIAFDYSGQLYGMTYELETPGDLSSSIIGTNLDKLSLVGGEVKVETVGHLTNQNGDRVMLQYNYMVTQDMDFDHEEWMLRVNGCVDGNTFYMTVDPHTAQVVERQLVGSTATVTGMYSPFSAADNAEAPAAVAGLKAQPAANGKKEITLSWTNPTKTWNRHELSSLVAVNVYRGEEIIAELTDGVALGAAMTYTDSEPADGVNVYKVVACRQADEEGKPSSVSTFAGKDVPGEVDSLSAVTLNGRDVVLSWQAPLAGKNNGWYDQTTLKYKVTRQPDGAVVADNLTACTFTDQPATTMEYTYEVTSSNAQGEGLTASSDPVVAGEAQFPPYSTDLDTEAEAALWTPDMQGCWEYLDWQSVGFDKAFIARVQNTWLYTPGFKLEAGRKYKVDYKLYVFNPGVSQEVDLMYGLEKNADAMTEELEMELEIDNAYNSQDFIYTITPSKSGTYYFGVLAKTMNGDNKATCCGGFAITPIADADLGVDNLRGHRELSAKSEGEYSVDVTNCGSNPAKEYKVQLIDDNGVVLVEKAMTKELKAGETVSVKLPFTPAAASEGRTLEVYGRVIMEGDGNPNNDLTDGMEVEICKADGGMWVTYSPKAWEEVESNDVPLDFKYKANCSEVIYNAEDLPLTAKNYKITKISYEYSFATLVDAEFTTYMGMTDQAGFTEAGLELVGKDNLKKVGASKIEFDAEAGELVLHLDTPYNYTKGRNLVVAQNREFTTYADGSTYDNFFKAVRRTDGKLSTLVFHNDEASFGWTSESTMYTLGEVPVTHFYFVPSNEEAVETVYFGQTGNSSCYNLAGQRVGSSFKGIVILNGKKVLK